MARRREFYDATKKERRDETWRRWKGGQKLADELRLFYTSKSTLDRIAANNALVGGLSAGKPAANGELRSALRREALSTFLSGERQGQQRGWPGIVARAKATAAAAAPASDGLPGQTGPKR